MIKAIRVPCFGKLLGGLGIRQLSLGCVEGSPATRLLSSSPKGLLKGILNRVLTGIYRGLGSTMFMSRTLLRFFLGPPY